MGNKLIRKMAVLSLMAAFIAGSALQVQAQEKPKQKPFVGKLAAVDKEAKTITLPGKEKNHVYHITAQTKITLDGTKPGTLGDAVIGEQVAGLARENGNGKWEAVSLRLGPKPEGETKPKKKKEES